VRLKKRAISILALQASPSVYIYGFNKP